MTTCIITASYDKQVRFWDPTSGRTSRNFVFQDSQINALSLSPDRCRLAVAGYGVIRYFDVASSAQNPPVVSSLEHLQAGNFTAIGHIPLTHSSGALMYACSEDGTLRLLEPRSAPNIRVLREFATNVAITCATLSSDNALLLAGSQIGKVTVWHCQSLVSDAASSSHSSAATKPLQEISFAGDHSAVRSIAVSPLLNWVAVATNTGKVHCLQFTSNSSGGPNASAALGTSSFLTASSQPAHQRSLSDNAALASDSQSVDNASTNDAAGGPTPADGAIDESSSPGVPLPQSPAPKTQFLTPLQQKHHLERVHTMVCHHKYILKCAISPDGKILATCCADYTVGLWQVPQLLLEKSGAECTAPPSALMSPSTDQSTATAQWHDAPASPGPTPLASTAVPSPKVFPPTSMLTPERLSNASGVPVPPSYDFAPLKPLVGHTRWVWDCAFSPCSTALVTVSSDNHVRLWSNITSQAKSDVFVGHSKPVVCVILDVDRRRADT